MIKLFSPLIFVGGAVLAQLEAKPESSIAIGAWLVSGAAVLHILKTALDTYKSHFKESPDPKATYATRREIKEQLDGVETRSKERDAANARLIGEAQATNERRHQENGSRLDGIDGKLDRNLAAYQDAHREELRMVHERINRADEELAGIRGEMKHVAANADRAANGAIMAAEAARGAIQAASQRRGND